MSDLTAKEQKFVRATLLFLRVRAGGAWEPVAKALHVEEDTIAKVVCPHCGHPPEDFVDEETVITDQVCLT